MAVLKKYDTKPVTTNRMGFPHPQTGVVVLEDDEIIKNLKKEYPNSKYTIVYFENGWDGCIVNKIDENLDRLKENIRKYAEEDNFIFNNVQEYRDYIYEGIKDDEELTENERIAILDNAEYDLLYFNNNPFPVGYDPESGEIEEQIYSENCYMKDNKIFCIGLLFEYDDFQEIDH